MMAIGFRYASEMPLLKAVELRELGFGLCDCHQCGRKFNWGEECWHEGDILCSSCFDLEYEKYMKDWEFGMKETE